MRGALLIFFASFELAFFLGADALECYKCVSGKDDGCGSSDPEKLKNYIKTCEPLEDGTFKGTEAKACRKIVQSVEDAPERIIRECAYTGDVNIDGQRKQGNKAIKMLYYQCENKAGEKPCNEGSSSISSALMLVAGLLVAFRA